MKQTRSSASVPQGQMYPISPRTASNYKASIQAALSYSQRQRTTDWEMAAQVTLAQVIEDNNKRTDHAESTKKLLRFALLWGLRSGYIESSDIDSDRNLVSEGWTLVSCKKRDKQRKNTIPEGDLKKILERLQEKAVRSKWAKRTAVFLRAGLATGVRPVEWLHAEWFDATKTVLRIRNAKEKLAEPAFLREPSGAILSNKLRARDADTDAQSDQRFDGLIHRTHSFRVVPIESEKDRIAVEEQIQLINLFIGVSVDEVVRQRAFVSYHRACLQVLNRTCFDIWQGKKRYQLYTMRGQFAADTKAACGSAVATVRLGHTRDDSPSAAFYGKANQAHSKFKGKRETIRKQDIVAKIEAEKTAADAPPAVRVRER